MFPMIALLCLLSTTFLSASDIHTKIENNHGKNGLDLFTKLLAKIREKDPTATCVYSNDTITIRHPGVANPDFSSNLNQTNDSWQLTVQKRIQCSHSTLMSFHQKNCLVTCCPVCGNNGF